MLKKRSFQMHDIEQQLSQDGSTGTITDLPRQAGRQESDGGADDSPMTKKPGRPRPPLAVRFLAIGVIVLLALTVIFSAVLLRGRLTAQRGSATVPPQNPPSASATGSSQAVYVTITGDVAYTGAGDVSALRASSGSLLWRASIEGAATGRPVVVNGVVYVTAATEITATLYALRASDGTRIWQITSNGPEISTPLVANGVVYLGTQEDRILALRADSGKILWQFSDHDISFFSPQLVDGVIYVSAIDEKPGNVYALRASDGRLLWHYKAGAALDGTTVINGVAYVTTQDGTLVALRASDGLRLWQRVLGGGNIGTLWQMQVLDDVLYVATTKMSVPTASTSGPGLPPQTLTGVSLLQGFLQVAPARQTLPHKEGLADLYALRISDGTTLWHLALNNGKNGMLVWLSGEHGVIYASVMDSSTPNASKGHTYALQSATGSLLWRYDDTTTSPTDTVMANGAIYVSAYSQDSNVVYALRARDGFLLWRHVMDQAIYNAPVPHGAVVYVGTADGSLDALRADNGAVWWQQSV